MALSHTDLEMVTVHGVTFLIDPSTFVEGCTYLLVGSGTVEPFDSVPVPSAALLLKDRVCRFACETRYSL